MSDRPTSEHMELLRKELDAAIDRARKEGANQVLGDIMQGRLKLPPLDRTIFVAIAAYCEPHLELTLDSLFANALMPQNLRVGLFDQNNGSNVKWLERKSYWKQIRYLHVDHTMSRGACWARSVTGSMYQNEDYYFQIDSHTIFDLGWDRILLRAHEIVAEKVDKPIITTYPLPFSFEDGKAVKSDQRNGNVYMMGLLPTADFDSKGINYGVKVYYEQGMSFKEGFHIAGGFIFAAGSFVQEVPYDPYLYFEGEEQNLAVRAYTHGWTIFHPSDKYIPLYHLYKASDPDAAKRSQHWNSEHEEERKEKWVDQYRRAEKRLADLLFHGKNMGIYGLGKRRTLGDFAALSGIDFQNRTIEDRAYANKIKPEKKG